MAAPFGEDQDDEPVDGPADDAPDAPAAETTLKVGAPFHLFHVVKLIGRGGTSEVYEILFKGATWALKVPRRGFELTAEQRKRFEDEAIMLIRIHHRNVVDVQEYGFNEGVFWIRMELLDGLDLREAITRLGAMSVGLVGAWLVQAAHGVHQCHVFGLVHRDLKPENVFITRDNIVKILDFGIVKYEHAPPTMQTGQGTAAPIGTAPYMSPEQARANLVSAASDVYALGMMMTEMLIGEHPFLLGGAPYDFWSMLQKQVLEPAPLLTAWGFSPELSGVAERALSKRPEKRQPNGLAFAQELLQECKRYLHAHPDEEPNPGEPTIAWLLEANMEVPSFGTGPQAGRPSIPPPRGSKPPHPVRLSAEPRPAIRFGTLPLGTPELEERDTEPTPPPIDAHDAQPEALQRDTDPSGPPLEIRRYDTISLPPALRDPTAIRALAAYRTTGPRPPGSAPAAPRRVAVGPASPPEAAPSASDRPAVLPSAAPLPAGPTQPERHRSAPTDAAGDASRARAGTPTVAVVPVPTRAAPSTAAPPPPQAPVPKRQRGGLPRLPRTLLRSALLVLGGFAGSLALTLEVRVGRPVVEAGPSLALPPPAQRAATTVSASSAVPPSPTSSAASTAPAMVPAAPTPPRGQSASTAASATSAVIPSTTSKAAPIASTSASATATAETAPPPPAGSKLGSSTATKRASPPLATSSATPVTPPKADHRLFDVSK